MAYTTQTSASNTGLVQRFAALRASITDALARRRVYKTTMNELSNLSTRDLNDLGIDRSSIRAVSYQAAYGV